MIEPRQLNSVAALIAAETTGLDVDLLKEFVCAYFNALPQSEALTKLIADATEQGRRPLRDTPEAENGSIEGQDAGAATIRRNSDQDLPALKAEPVTPAAVHQSQKGERHEP